MFFFQISVLGALLLEKTLQLEYARESYPFVEAIQRQTRKALQPETTGDVSGRASELNRNVTINHLTFLLQFQIARATSCVRFAVVPAVTSVRVML